MTGRPDPLQLPETGGPPKRPRRSRRPAPLTPGQLAAAGLATFFGTLGVALFVTGGLNPWGFLAGVGWGAVLVLAYRWAAALDA